MIMKGRGSELLRLSDQTECEEFNLIDKKPTSTYLCPAES